MREVISPEEAERRLHIIFPRSAFDTVLSSPLAGMAIAALVYIDAVCKPGDAPESVVWARPSTVTWMSDEVLVRTSHADRLAWRDAAAKNSQKVSDLLTGWGAPFRPRYKDNSRETLRDETFREWHEHGALRKRHGIPISSSRPRWALLSDFADLFDPHLGDEDLEQAAHEWRQRHMDPGARLRAAYASDSEAAEHAIAVTLPNGTSRVLEPGDSSKILKGVIELWAPNRLMQPVVLAISEPSDKVHVGDERMLGRLGISIDFANVLPDAIIADVGVEPVQFWLIEAVASDGPVSDRRRKKLLEWAEQQNIAPQSCSFLTAFWSRNAGPAKKRLKDIAAGTWAWFLDEPERELAWYSIQPVDEG